MCLMCLNNWGLNQPKMATKIAGVPIINHQHVGYPLVNVCITMEDHHFQWENPLFLWSFSVAMLNYQRVLDIFRHTDLFSKRASLADFDSGSTGLLTRDHPNSTDGQVGVTTVCQQQRITLIWLILVTERPVWARFWNLQRATSCHKPSNVVLHFF